MPQGLKAAKDAYKKKNSSAVGGSTGSYTGPSPMRDGPRGQKRENPYREKQNKRSVSQNLGNFSGSSWGNQNRNQNNRSDQNNWGSRRSEATLWLQLVNKLLKKSLLPVC